MSKKDLDRYFGIYDVKRLEMYALNLVDYHLVLDLVPSMAKLYFTNQLDESATSLSLVQAAILIGMGLQYKSIEELEKELQLPPNQLLAMFNKIVKKYIGMIESKTMSELGKEMFKEGEAEAELKENGKRMAPLEESLEDELEEEARKVKQKEMEEKRKLIGIDLKQYEIKGSEKEWTDALKLPVKSSYVSIKRFFPTFSIFSFSKIIAFSTFILAFKNDREKRGRVRESF